jgi:hypothetical protein
MLLRFSAIISTVNGICGSCDYTIKWQIIRCRIAQANAGNSDRSAAQRFLAQTTEDGLEVLRS